MSETWKPISGYEGCYEVSDLGRVRSLDRQSHGFRAGRMLKQNIGVGNGYLYVTLYRKPHKRRANVHTLVLEAFAGPRPDGMEACHNDGDRTNPRLSNLRWGTHSENIYDIVRHGNHFQSTKTRCKNGHPMTPDNVRVNAKGQRTCRPCARRRNAAYKASKRQKKES